MKYTEKIHRAIIRASILHKEQKRKGDNSPYINHPYAVGFILGQYVNNEDIVVAGILHDVLEDVAGYSRDDMECEFGRRVLEIVEDVTEKKDPSTSKKIKKDTWQIRKNAYITHLSVAKRDALLVSCADKIHNMLTLIDSHKEYGEQLWKKFGAPKEKSLWFYGMVLFSIKKRCRHPLVKEYERVYKKFLQECV